jgi:hypothetical protein
MKTLSFALCAALAVAACGGSIGVDPITRGADGAPGGSNASTEPGATTNSEPAPDPVAPIAPYTGDVSTNDVSILYPMPKAGESTDFVKPKDAGKHGQLLPVESFTTVVPGDALERTDSSHASGYGQLALISVRLDHCSARKGPSTCTPEVRAVFQAIYDKTSTLPDGDPSTGSAAQDGGVHVIYEVGEAELVVMMKQLLTLRKAHGDLTATRLEVHPILAKQGLGGAFAKGLKDILLEHLGAARISRITTFDHNMDLDGDGWTFQMFDGQAGVVSRKKIPTLDVDSMIVGGSNAFLGPFAETNAFTFAQAKTDSVEPLVRAERPAKFDPAVGTQMQPAFQNAIRIQNPTIHNAETTDCVNCHLAEGAHLIAENVYALKAIGEFTAPGGTNYLLERSSVTNLHAFGYLHRKVSIMQRTANESTVVRDWMNQKVK